MSPRIILIVFAASIIILLINYGIYIWFWKETTPIFISDEKYFNTTLAKILKPRWPGSFGHSEVLNFLIEELQELGFAAVRDELFDQIPFTNVLGIINMEASDFILLSCHYDSKFTKSNAFYVGATDGAVSCAILLSIAKSLKTFLTGEFSKRKDIGLMLTFFDGHESFEDETQDTNSLNGSRRFALEETIPLKSIELIITLNLIGAPNHIYMSHYDNTYLLHKLMANIEQQLKKAGQLTDCHQLFHNLKDHDSDIEDDHYPFLEEGS
ncbi:GH16890 [Drosophila grimshawi]|uniref:glutaminyl-peptide cyclotransferase n=1 Tax=Drosophila grimshawi TaxID=7222 RepID=B4IXK5_DROGR|nr:GH16890 [Drosophila grimshawi]